MSPIGTSRQFVATQHFGRVWSEADIRQATPNNCDLALGIGLQDLEQRVEVVAGKVSVHNGDRPLAPDPP
jgi:hypothetical protein